MKEENLMKRMHVVAVLLAHVDDILIMVEQALCRKIKQLLTNKFEMKNMSSVNIFLNMRIIRDRATHSLIIDQSHYISAVLDEMNWSGLNPVTVPMSEATYKSLDQISSLLTPELTTIYRGLTAKLNYVAFMTRLDVAWASMKLSTYNKSPTENHIEAVKKTWRWLSGTRETKLQYTSSSESINEGSPFLAFFDSS